MHRRPSHLVLAFALAGFSGLGLGACQLINGIGDDVVLGAEAGSDGSPDVAASTDAYIDAPTEAGAVAPDADAASAPDALPDVTTDAGPDADAGPAEGGPAHAGCPLDAGTAMVRIDAPDASFCIDVTEVTRAQFATYALTHPPLGSSVPPACKTDAAAVPLQVPDDQAPENPVSGINFCYAWDYCAFVGKRLCGNLGGGPVVSAASSEWYYACSNGATTAYPYGNVFDAGACIVADAGPGPVGSKPGCHGLAPPFSLVLDMSGNLAEYDRTASSFDGSEDLPTITVRGGSFALSGVDVSCASEGYFGMYTDATQYPPDTGIRCCADVR